MPKIQANNINQYYEITGQGEPLVLVHGLGASTRDWEFQVPEFSKNYQVITYDLRGHGRSDKPAGPYQISQLAADLAGLLDALGTSAVHLVGHSLGGIVAFQFAVDYPQRVKTLTIANSVPTYSEDPRVTERDIEARTAVVREQGMRGMGEVLSGALFPKPEQAALREKLIERWIENDPQGYLATLHAVAGWNVTDRLDTIPCPALLISSDKDMWPLELKELCVERMPDARLHVIEDAHHFIIQERPDEFNAALKSFLAGN